MKETQLSIVTPTIMNLELSTNVFEEISLSLKAYMPQDLVPSEYRFFKLNEINHDTKQPHREAMENILASMNSPEFNTVYLIIGAKTGVSIYFGVTENQFYPFERSYTTYDSSRILQSAITGSFNGSLLEEVEHAQDDVFKQISSFKRAGVIFGVPTITENQQKNEIDFQGVDRLINSMLGEEWGFMVVCEPIHTDQISDMQNKIYDIYDVLHPLSSTHIQQTVNSGESTQQTEGTTTSKTKTKGINESKNQSSGTSHGDSESSKNKGSSNTQGTSTSKSVAKSDSTQVSTGQNKGSSESHDKEFINKKLQEALKYIDDELLERLKYGKNKGLFKTSVYSLAKDNATQTRLQMMIVSVFQGNSLSYNPLQIRPMITSNEEHHFLKQITQMQIYDVDARDPDIHNHLLYNRAVNGKKVSCSTFLTTRELSLFISVPTQEIPGVALKRAVNFGLNLPHSKSSEPDSITLGFLIDNGRNLRDNKISLNKSEINKHIFITGVTGSGKTTTCMKLLAEANLPFLVIEPAKTEYRKLWKTDKSIRLFTLGNEQGIPFRFNPFELLPDEAISSHIDMVKAAFIAAFPMEAAMPQLIEGALYNLYEAFGWNIETNAYERDPSETEFKFPTFLDFVTQLKSSIKAMNFGAELRANYEGALISRFSSFTIGVKGLMLNCYKSLDFDRLLESNVIIEMEDLKDDADKALMMGLLLSRINEALKRKHKTDPSFKHITLIEEAHRLLSKYEPGGSPGKSQGVSVFTNMLAEVRKYGESMIIVDQIPNKLTTEVLKNTNTKIIHKLFAKDDKDSVGDTMSMDEEQRNYLSNLETGEAIVFSHGWAKPIWMMIEQNKSTTNVTVDDEISKEEITEMRKIQYTTETSAYLPYPALPVEFPSEDIPQLRSLLKRWSKVLSDYNIKNDSAAKAWLEAYIPLESILAAYYPSEQIVTIAATYLYRTNCQFCWEHKDRTITAYSAAIQGINAYQTDLPKLVEVFKQVSNEYKNEFDSKK